MIIQGKMLMSLFSIEGIGEEVILSVFAFVTALILFGYYMMRFENLMMFFCLKFVMYWHFCTQD